MPIHFDKYVQTGREFVKKIAIELGDPDDLNIAGRLLRSTLHVLRDQSTPEESVQFISQLPMLIKALYVDGWRLASKKGRVHRMDQFIDAVRKQNHSHGNDDFSSDDGLTYAIGVVFQVIKEYVSEGEIEDMRRTLPEDLRPLLL